MATAAVTTDPRWGDVLVEEATEAAGRARLARQAVAFDRARHPGVAELVEHDDDGDRAVLVVRPQGRRSLADLPGLAPDQVAAVGAAAAQTLADLHRSGVSHGSLRPDRIFLTALGQPVLTGLADAGLADPPPGQSSNFDPGADVEALADLLEHLLDPAEATQRRGSSLLGVLHRAAGSPMEDLAAALAELAGPLQPPLREDGDPFADLGWLGDATREFWPSPAGRVALDPSPPRIGRRTIWLAGLALLAVLAGALAVAVLRGPGPSGSKAGGASAPSASAAPSGPSGLSAPSEGGLAAPTSATPTSAGPAPAAPATAPAGCPTSYDEAAAVGIPASCAADSSVHGNTVQIGPLTWIIGSDEDRAVVGDFDCDGWLEAMALAPASAQVVAFDGWAGAGQEPTGRLVRVVPGATGLEARPESSCHRLVVTGPSAAPVVVDLAGRP